MRQFTKWFAAIAVVAGVGVAAQTASAAGPVKVFKTYPSYPTYPYPMPFPNPGPFPPRPLPFPVPPPRIDFDYVVLYKPGIFSGTRVYGRYETRFQAENAARRLEFSGFPTRIERFRDNGLYGW